MAYEIKVAGYTIHGPVKGSQDLHPSFTVYTDNGPVLASFYAADGDLLTAEGRAKTFCLAVEAKKALEHIDKGDAVVFDNDLQCDVEVSMNMDQAQALARHALSHF